MIDGLKALTASFALLMFPLLAIQSFVVVLAALEA